MFCGRFFFSVHSFDHYSRTCPFRLNGFRDSGISPLGATSLYPVPILGRQPCQFAWISLSSVRWHTFHSSPLHPSLPAFPLPTSRTVNADKRYLRRGLFRTSASRTAQLLRHKFTKTFLFCKLFHTNFLFFTRMSMNANEP